VPNQSQFLPHLSIHRKPLNKPRNQPVFVEKDWENMMKKRDRCEGKPSIPKHLAYDIRFGFPYTQFCRS
jgi:hypothetical protein